MSSELSSALGLETYCPMYRKWRRLPKHKARAEGRSKELIFAPLLIGYVFVRATYNYDHYAASQIDGYMGLLQTSNYICVATDQEIATLKLLESNGFADESIEMVGQDLIQSIQELSTHQNEQAFADSIMKVAIGSIIQLTSGPLIGAELEVVGHNRDDVVVMFGDREVVVSTSDYRLVA